MTDNQKELLRLWNEADASGKQLVFEILACAVAFGEPFYKEAKDLIDKGDQDGIKVALVKYVAQL